MSVELTAAASRRPNRLGLDEPADLEHPADRAHHDDDPESRRGSVSCAGQACRRRRGRAPPRQGGGRQPGDHRPAFRAGSGPRFPCGRRDCGVDLVVENVDRPRPDQQRRSVLPAGVPSTSSTGHPRGACRDKAQRRGPASGHDSRVLTPRPSDTAHCARLVTRSLVRFGRRPGTSGRRPFVLSQHHSAPASTVAYLDLAVNPATAAGPGRPPDAAAVVGDRRIGSVTRRWGLLAGLADPFHALHRRRALAGLFMSVVADRTLEGKVPRDQVGQSLLRVLFAGRGRHIPGACHNHAPGDHRDR